MSKRRQYAICLAAYLTGWVIAQNIYNRLSRAWLGGDDSEVQAWRTELAVAVADEVESRHYPRRDGHTIVLGPECFASEDECVISWRGENYYRDFHHGDSEPREEGDGMETRREWRP
jgi:hypothetical protein